MKKKKGKSFIVISILILIIVGLGLYLYFYSDLFNNNVVKEKIKSNSSDNIYGIYVFSEDLGVNKRVFNSCYVSAINNYLLVMGDKYYVYRGTCVATYYVDSGSVGDLAFGIDDSNGLLNARLDDKLYVKDSSILNIIPNVAVQEENDTVSIEALDLLIKLTEFKDHYYDFDFEIMSNKNISVTFKQIGNQFVIGLKNKEKELYSYTMDNLDNVPQFYNKSNGIVIIENNSIDSNVNYNMKIVDTVEGIGYNLDSMFPIKIDGNELDLKSYNSFIYYDTINDTFKIFLSKNKDFCVADSESSIVAYYVFSTNYDYATRSFKNIEFLKTVKEKDGCAEIKSIIG